MSTIIKDALGAPLQEGDEVAYIARHGSSVSIERRQIAELREYEDSLGRVYHEVRFGYQSRWARAYNCVLVESYY